jgi:hypothetical protein
MAESPPSPVTRVLLVCLVTSERHMTIHNVAQLVEIAIASGIREVTNSDMGNYRRHCLLVVHEQIA